MNLRIKFSENEYNFFWLNIMDIYIKFLEIKELRNIFTIYFNVIKII